MKSIVSRFVPICVLLTIVSGTNINAQLSSSSTIRSNVASTATGFTVSTAANDEPAAAASSTAAQGQAATDNTATSPYESPAAVTWSGVFNSLAATAGSETGELPELMLHSEISEKERQELTEDLQILEALLLKATTISGGRPSTNNRVLGVNVHRGESPSRIFYLQDFGVQFRLQTSQISFAKSPESVTAEKTKDDAKETDWDVARRELFSERQGFYIAAANEWREPPAPRHDEKSVETIIEQVTRALDNIGRIRFPESAVGTKQFVAVYLTCPADGSVLSIRRGIQCAKDPKESTLEAVTTHRHIDPAVRSNTANRFLFRGVPGPSSFLAPAQPPAAVAPTAQSSSSSSLAPPPAIIPPSQR